MGDPFFKFSNLSKFPGVVHGVSTRAYGNMYLKDDGLANRQHFLNDLGINLEDLITSRQIHSSKVIPVGQREKVRQRRISHWLKNQEKLTADGLITREKNIFLGVTVADCLPVLIYDPNIEVTSAIHAGWRGIIGQIIPPTIERFRQIGSEPENLIVAIGPGICQKHFVVKNDVLEKFHGFYPSATFVRNHDGYVDLRKAISVDIKKARIPRHNVEISNDCPACLNGIYGSFRKEGEGAPASLAVIGMKD